MTSISTLPPEKAHVLAPLLRQVHDLHVAHQPEAYAPPPDDAGLIRFLSDWLSNPALGTLIAGPAQTPTGYLIYEEQHTPASALKPARHHAMLHHICVDARYRRQGIASALIARLRTECRTSGIPTIVTSYAAFNTASAQLMAEAGLAPKTIIASGKA